MKILILSLLLTNSLSFANTEVCDVPATGDQECNQIFLLTGAIYPKAVACLQGFDSADKISIDTGTSMVSYSGYDGISHDFSYVTCGDEVYFTKLK